MTYTIEIGHGLWGPEYYQAVRGERKARKAAVAACREHPNDQVFVSWFRSSDGQHGYLNRDGNHAITGRDWNAANLENRAAARRLAALAGITATLRETGDLPAVEGGTK